MELNWFEALLYGFVCGITEFLPISSQSHSAVMLKLFGCEQNIALLRLFTHIGCLAGVFAFMHGHLSALRKQAILKKIPPKRRKRFPDPRLTAEISLVKMAAVPVILSMFLYPWAAKQNSSLQLVAIFSVVNGAVLMLPHMVSSGNKDARSTSVLDRMIIGFSAFLAVLPGVSRIAATTSFALIRGVDREKAYHWSLLLSLPALCVMVLWDFYLLINGAVALSFVAFLLAFLAGAAAFVGALLAASWMHALIKNSSIEGFGYYSLGMALFAFILYLI